MAESQPKALRPVVKERIGGLACWLNPDAKEADAARAFIASGDFRKMPDSSLLSSNNRRNRIWSMQVDDSPCILKEAFIPSAPNYSLGRRIDIFFSLLLRKRGLKSLRMARRLGALGFRTMAPIAFWTEGLRRGLRQYYLYKFLDGESLDSALRGMGEDPSRRAAVESCYLGLGREVRALHDARIHHTDLLQRNILCPAPDGSDPRVGIIDLESANPALPLPTKGMRFANDMYSLRRIACSTPPEFLHTLIRGYCEKAPGDEPRVAEELAAWHEHGAHSHRVFALRRYLRAIFV